MIDFERDLDELRNRITELEAEGDLDPASDVVRSLELLRLELDARTADVFSRLTPWQRVQIARHRDRPHTLDFIERMVDGFVELHGDRRHGDDMAIVGGVGTIDGRPVVVVGHQKGRGTRQNVERNFGMAHPEGYRKAVRLFELAERFGLPVVTLLDTPGAGPALEDEERGQSWAIAESMASLARLETPVIVTVIGEGGSGGALAMGVGDRILMLEHAIYSVASPEAAASIVWRDAKFAERAAAALGLTSDALLAADLVDQVVAEPAGGAHRDYDEAARNLKAAVLNVLRELAGIDTKDLVADRYAKFRAISAHIESPEREASWDAQEAQEIGCAR
jgi:acetyl-CoA carboxylase carboxyl transferase subunit alpha